LYFLNLLTDFIFVLFTIGIHPQAHTRGHQPILIERAHIQVIKKIILNHPNQISLVDVHQQFEIKGGKL